MELWLGAVQTQVSFMRTSNKAMTITFKIEDANGGLVVPCPKFGEVNLGLKHDIQDSSSLIFFVL